VVQTGIDQKAPSKRNLGLHAGRHQANSKGNTMSAQDGRNLPTVSGFNSSIGQDSLSLHQLAQAIRDAHADASAAFSNEKDRALDGGQALIIATKRVPHGERREFYKYCGIGERTAQRYMQFAEAMDSNPSLATDLAGLTIKDAIKKLSPPKLLTGRKRDTKILAKPQRPDAVFASPVSHIDIIDVGRRQRYASAPSTVSVWPIGSMSSPVTGFRSSNSFLAKRRRSLNCNRTTGTGGRARRSSHC
jgi:hypothetical protein